MYIGIDLGTSAVKLLLMEKDGEILNIVSREYPIAFPHPGWSEQAPTDWWNTVKEGIPALLHSFAHADCAQKLVKIKSETRPEACAEIQRQIRSLEAAVSAAETHRKGAVN